MPSLPTQEAPLLFAEADRRNFADLAAEQVQLTVLFLAAEGKGKEDEST